MSEGPYCFVCSEGLELLTPATIVWECGHIPDGRGLCQECADQGPCCECNEEGTA
jgi:hypothetical protein